MVCGYGDSVGYEQLANDLAKARIDKSSRFTDWSRRPLNEAQLVYAEADVTHLRDIYLALKADLEETGRESWVAEEMAVLNSPATYEVKPENAWQRLKGRIRKPRSSPCSWSWPPGASARGAAPRRAAPARAQGRCRDGHRPSGRRGPSRRWPSCAPYPTASSAPRSGGEGAGGDRTRARDRSQDPATAGARTRPRRQRRRARPAQGCCSRRSPRRACRAEDHCVER